METLIIGLSGKKQSGKNTASDHIIEYLSENFELPNGIKTFSFADALKQKICIDVLGIEYEQCYGTNEQKDSPTVYLWENLPREIRYHNRLGEEYASNGEVCRHILPKGPMTAREIMQVVGTDLFRHYFDDNIWVNATFREILRVKPDVAIISDVRFPSEVNGVISNGGFIVRLLRNVCETDNHESETALDDYDFESARKDKVCVLDNREMSIEQQQLALISEIDIVAGEKLRRIDYVS